MADEESGVLSKERLDVLANKPDLLKLIVLVDWLGRGIRGHRSGSHGGSHDRLANELLPEDLLLSDSGLDFDEEKRISVICGIVVSSSARYGTRETGFIVTAEGFVPRGSHKEFGTLVVMISDDSPGSTRVKARAFLEKGSQATKQALQWRIAALDKLLELSVYSLPIVLTEELVEGRSELGQEAGHEDAESLALVQSQALDVAHYGWRS